MYYTEISNFLNILARIKNHLRIKKDKDVAELLGLSPNHLSNIKRVAAGKPHTGVPPKNLPFKQLIEWATENNVDLNWLFSGQAKDEDHQPWLESIEPFRPALDNLSEEQATCLAEVIEPLLRRGVLGTQPGVEEKSRPQKAVKK